MIWNTTQPDRPATHDPLAAHILAELAALDCGPDPAAAARRQAAVESAAAFLRRNAVETLWSNEYLWLVTARALWAAGDAGAARRLLAQAGRRANLSSRHAAVSCARDVHLPAWASFCAARVVRPAAFSSCDCDTLWILDLHRLAVAGNVKLELTLMRALQTALARMAPVWEAARGRGAVAFADTRRAAGLILSLPHNARRCRRLARELDAYALACLRDIGRARGWRSVPMIVGLDLDRPHGIS